MPTTPLTCRIKCVLFSVLLGTLTATDAKSDAPPSNLAQTPTVGFAEFQILSPTLLELTRITTKSPEARPAEWNFVNEQFSFVPPPTGIFQVTAGGRKLDIAEIGFKRRPVYAPLRRRDLRLGNYLYITLGAPIRDGEKVIVTNPNGRLWPKDQRFEGVMAPTRFSPVLHVNQEGYAPNLPKRAMAGYYLGTLGEMDIAATNFNLIDAITGNVVFTGSLSSRRDGGYEPAAYQQVLEADFSDLAKPGQYRLQVPGIGCSAPFAIDGGIPSNFARAFALGLYHQRCGTANQLPFTRFVHGPCHSATAEVPNMKFEAVNEVLAKETGNFSANPRHTARQLKNVDTSLYPFVRKGKIDVAGGHHDAGDYSKYTINSAQLIHVLILAADIFPGVSDLDNLGLPESGDGKGDVLQEAKWESDFLAKLQDDDGGFYFMVYPRDRQYEHDVMPDKGDSQVVYPKTTAATAAAVAALAQIASSPAFKKQFPDAAAAYLAKAKKGWAFLDRAFAKYGRDGSYQKITHYGDEFMHDDEITWAAAELFLATGDEKFHKELIAHFDPTNRETRRWTWWRLFECYGCAIRSYAFAAKTGRLPAGKLDRKFLADCENEIIANAEDNVRYLLQNAYGVSFPIESKRFRSAGWFFSTDPAFDLAAACQLDYPELNDPRPKFIDAIVANLNYEAGCNPVNVSFISGLGWKRPHEMVHHVAQNQRQLLPPSGLLWGNIQEGFAYLDPYKKELGELCFPPDWDKQHPYPFYDRWGDSFNTAQEFVVPNLARALAASAFLMARSTAAKQPWRAAKMEIAGLPTKVAPSQKLELRVKSQAIDVANARVVWEMRGAQPLILSGTESCNFAAPKPGEYWVEAEAHLPDGRRLFAATNVVVGVSP